jgi:hypothetical protein
MYLRISFLVFAMICFASCKRTKEVTSTLEEISFAGYHFEVIESKVIQKKTGEVVERTVDTLLVINCDKCKELCYEGEDQQDYRR